MRILLIVSLAVGLGGSTLLPRARADALDAMQARIISVSERVSPSVVHIEAAVKVNNRRNLVTGSGFIMNRDGIILTNEHVVERAEKVGVIVPGRAGKFDAEVVGTDKQTDLAVLRISLSPNDDSLPVAKLGDSDTLRVGEWVIAIGNPYGLDGTVSLGIISAKGRDLRAENLLNDFIQTDAMIDRGSSGGPLINLEGEVVGVNSRGQGRGIGFTIPINTAKRVAEELLGQGRIARGYLGVTIQPLNRELAGYWKIPDVHGVVVNGIVNDSPAYGAGLATGDIVTRFDGTEVRAEKDEDLGRFQRLVARTPVGKEIAIEVLRKGKSEVMNIKVDVQPKVVPDEEESEYGFTVQEVTAQLERLHRLESREGVLVSFVERGSEAAEAGLEPGDLIERMDERRIHDIEEFRQAIEELPSDLPFLLRARRGENVRFLLIVPRGTDRRAKVGVERPHEGS